MSQKDKPITSMSEDEREEVWDEVYAKEEGIIMEFNMDDRTGRIRSLLNGEEYRIDSRELVRTKIELQAGDKVLFAPIEDPAGENYARIVQIVELNS